MVTLLPLLLALPPALAGPNADACTSCCRDAGLSGCSTELYVVGEATKVSKEGSGWRASGLHVVSCDGRGFFDDGRTTVFSSVPSGGDVAKSSSAQWACFAQSCQLPSGLCFDDTVGHVSVCGTGEPPAAAAFRAAPAPRSGTAPASLPSAAPTAPGSVTVMVAGRALNVQVAGAQSAQAAPPAYPAPVAPPAPASPSTSTYAPPAPVAPAPAPAPTPKPKSTGILFDDLDDDEILEQLRAESDPTEDTPGGVYGGVVGPVLSAPAPTQSWSPSATPTYTPAPAPVPVAPSAYNTPPPTSTAPKLDAVAQLTQGLPRDPPEECEAPIEALRSEARKQVMTGDDLRLGKDAAGAIQKYRAALSMDACNGYAWLGLGESAVALERPDIAIRALRNATTLLPQHYGAWTELGQAYEAIQQVDMAISAYKKALALKPGLAVPMAGVQRLGG